MMDYWDIDDGYTRKEFAIEHGDRNSGFTH